LTVAPLAHPARRPGGIVSPVSNLAEVPLRLFLLDELVIAGSNEI
jgi:hypothetical protein